MNLLIVGGGGREHALAWKLAQSDAVDRLFVAPGNGGTAGAAKCENVAIPATDGAALLHFAQSHAVALTIVGPEEPLVRGIVDRFQAAGQRIFGPTAAAAQLEGSKAFAKQFMVEQNIPTAGAHTFNSYRDAIHAVMLAQEIPVIKVSGLAGGKGVYVPDCFSEAEAALHEIYIQQRFGAQPTVLLEERLEGPELSLLALCDGTSYRLMPAAQDHKRLLDSDAGPNTGGMGAFAPAPLATPSLLRRVGEQVIGPTLAGMAARGSPFVGVLYTGLMLTAAGPKVLEFNCRFGDPETQVILPLLQSDLLPLLLACTEGRLAAHEPQWHAGAAATVVMAAGGYPDGYAQGDLIEGLDEAAALPGVVPFHAGSVRQGGALHSAGGRVLAVTGVGATLGAALERAYAGVAKIRFAGAQFRKDIGARALSDSEEA